MDHKLNLTATESALEKIRDIVAEEDKQVRLSVEGGGCAGFNYKFMLDSDLNMDDFACDIGTNIKIIIDAMSAQYLDGSEIDYKEEFMNNRFVVNNPNAVSSCGCGSSFNPYK
jgi:iron-sulfur cluster insertion protein